MPAFEAIRSRVSQQLASVLMTTDLGISVSEEDQHSFIDVIENSLSSEADGLLHLDTRGREPVAIRYNIKGIIAGITPLIAGIHGPLIASLAALAGVWGLTASRKRLRPSHALIVQLLIQTDNSSEDAETLEESFAFWYRQIWMRSPDEEAFSSALGLLEQEEIVLREEGVIRLNESFVVTLA